MPQEEFISEPITPDALTFDTAAMAAGVPGIPSGFTWRDRHFQIDAVISNWNESEGCTHGSGERYLRKHFWKIRAATGETMTLYAVRKVKRGERPKQRWWLYTMASPEVLGLSGKSA